MMRHGPETGLPEHTKVVLGAKDKHVQAAVGLQMTLEAVDDFLAARDRRVPVDHVDPVKLEQVAHDLGEAELSANAAARCRHRQLPP